jgi:hypothetical protein
VGGKGSVRMDRFYRKFTATGHAKSEPRQAPINDATAIMPEIALP